MMTPSEVERVTAPVTSADALVIDLKERFERWCAEWSNRVPPSMFNDADEVPWDAVPGSVRRAIIEQDFGSFSGELTGLYQTRIEGRVVSLFHGQLTESGQLTMFFDKQGNLLARGYRGRGQLSHPVEWLSPPSRRSSNRLLTTTQ